MISASSAYRWFSPGGVKARMSLSSVHVSARIAGPQGWDRRKVVMSRRMAAGVKDGLESSGSRNKRIE